MKIEKIIFERLTTAEQRTEFLETHTTIRKLKYAVEHGVNVPEDFFLLQPLYNDALHLNDHANSTKNKIQSICLKLDNIVITDINYEGEAPYILLEAVEEQKEFVDFTPEGWELGKEDNEQLFKKFSERLRDREVNIAEIFPLSPIPLLIHMGFLLTDTLTLTIDQFDRDNQVWVNDKSEDKEKTAIKLNEYADVKGEKELAILVSVSGTVKISDVDRYIRKKY